MENIQVNPNLKVVRFDGSPKNCEEIKNVFGAEIKKIQSFHRLERRCQVHPEDAAAGWSGGIMSLKIERGQYITENNGALQILTLKQFNRFFIIAE